MTIKHLVISGGGAVGINYIAILQYLQENDFWNIKNIQSIYATSVGSFVSIILCLNYDWNTISTYLIERPWQDVFTITGKQIISAYYNKGIYDKKIIETIFKPLLEAKDLSLNITLKEFYDFSKIDLYFYSFELNSFQTIELSHKSHPDLSLLTAVNMSSSIPGLFTPVIDNNECYIDGGFIDNYPLNHCLKNIELIEEVLGLNYVIFANKTTNQRLINKDSTILDFILDFSIKSMNHISNSVITPSIPYEIVYKFDESPISFNFTSKIIQSKEMRKLLYDDGFKIAKEFLLKIETNITI
jgi:predicted acylesterase/phospholipase RssA